MPGSSGQCLWFFAAVFAIQGVFLAPRTVYYLYDYLDTTDLTDAEAFRDQLHQAFQATVLERGIEWCEDQCDSSDYSDYAFKKCALDDQTDPQCAAVQGEYFPVTSRRLATLRRLRCLPDYLPWIRVQFQNGTTSVTRCAYLYGTRTNSKTSYWSGPEHQDSWEQDARDVIESRSAPTLSVWTPTASDYCIVGFGSLDKLVDGERTPMWKWLSYLGYTVLCFMPCVGLHVYKRVNDAGDEHDYEEATDSEEERSAST
eukprot:TRINITY_DN80813_c0_g1_i1.p1 TRINITY_DN80813_c0_g1~~TRINITY_DN80813_c0_g1_i1.p1  ORF type:complete len:257 (+),score=5.28 TRINITY_DN80813_c0_g1_i1:131-901(+)